MECHKCQSQDGDFKEGVSRKTGRPWRGWKCKQCGDMVFLPSKTNSPKPQETDFLKVLRSIDSNVQRIAQKLELKHEPLEEVTNEESDAPF